ncbi:MAG: hypothetical protein AAF492_16385, partial [Verrucomicrobiota bacterium]
LGAGFGFPPGGMPGAFVTGSTRRTGDELSLLLRWGCLGIAGAFHLLPENRAELGFTTATLGMAMMGTLPFLVYEFK